MCEKEREWENETDSERMRKTETENERERISFEAKKVEVQNKINYQMLFNTTIKARRHSP